MDYNPDLNKLQMDVAVLQQQLADLLTAQNNAFLPETHYHIPLPFDDTLNFSVSVSGNQATVVGGYWQGTYEITLVAPSGSQNAPVKILSLAGATEWIFVSSSKQGTPAPIIDHIASTTKPQTDDSNYYVVLARCYSFDLKSWFITEVNYAGGDIDPKAPLL